jgi:amino-acid N-acetyltransferase
MLRKARQSDVESILDIIEPFVKKGILLQKNRQDIVNRLRDYFVYEENDELTGCAALFPGWNSLGEICTLAVVEHMQKKGIGKQLVQACIEDAKELGLPKIFTLTYEKEFFAHLGFREEDKESLPQKIFKDCIKCPHYHECSEIAMVLTL